MRVAHKLIIFIIAISIIISSILFSFYFRLSSVDAPDFSFKTVEGEMYNLSDFEGKVVVLDFMATWCEPCKKMTENLKELQKENPELIIISVDIDPTESIEKVKAFRNKYNATWFFTIDTTGINKDYGVVGIPRTFVINPAGEIFYSHTGVISTSRLADKVEKANTTSSSHILLFNFGLPIIALTAGILSFFSPCSFPLLPAYIGYYLGKEKMGDVKKSGMVKRGIIKGVQPALGILSFYSVVGLSIILAGDSIKYMLPVFNPIAGVIIIILGIVMVTKIPLFGKLSSSLTGSLSKLLGNKRFDLYMYGIIYGVAAAGCTMPIFLSIILIAISLGNLFSGILIFLLYVTGMMGLMIIVTVLLSISTSKVRKLAVFSKYVEKIGGVLMIFAGLLLIYYAFV